MSAEASGWVFKNSPYEGAQLLCHLVVADVVNAVHDYEFWMSMANMARFARCSRQTASKAMKRMVDESMVELLEERPGGTNLYRFLMPETPVIATEEGVNSGDTPVTEGANSGDTHLSSEATGGVNSGDTIPIEPNQEPKDSARPDNTPASAPHSPAPQAHGARDSRNPQQSTGDKVPQMPTGSNKIAWGLCVRLADRIEQVHGYHPDPGTGSWMRDMGLLLDRGPTGVTDHPPIPAKGVEALIDFIFDHSQYENGFRWADQIDSPGKLRQHWLKVRKWGLATLDREKGEQQSSGEADWMNRSN